MLFTPFLFVILIISPIALLYSLLGLYYAPTLWKRYLFVLVIEISLAAYIYNPINGPDLERYFEMITECQGLSLKEAIEYFDDGLLLENIFFWIAGKLKLPHLIPAISTGVVYGVTGYITCDTAREFKAEKKIFLVLVMQAAFLPFISIVNNVRNVCAFSLVILAVYIEVVKKKMSWGVLMLYVLPCFLHTTAMIFVAIRLTLFLTRKIKFWILIIIGFIPNMIQIAYSYIEKIPTDILFWKIVRNIVIKGKWYLQGFDNSQIGYVIAKRLNTKIDKINLMIVTVLLMILIFYYQSLDNIKYAKNKKFIDYMYMICVMIIACNFFESTQYWRFSAACVVASGALLIPLLQRMGKKQLGQVISINIYLLEFMCMPCVLVHLWKGKNLIEPINFITAFCLNDIYVVLAQIVYHIMN